jgi:putative glutamine amidotransferase
MQKADVVVFPGGSDINPVLYNEPRGALTYFHTATDMRQMQELKRAMLLAKPIVGICRGAQLICAVAGGKLVQDQCQPSRHDILTPFDTKVSVCSIHHQAQYPWKLKMEEDWRLYGWSEGVAKHHVDAYGNEMVNGVEPANGKEVEIAYYPKLKALAIQSHPELAAPGSEEAKYCRFLVAKLMKGEL